MAGRLAGKTAIISGGATGMGGAASKLFAAEGAKVAIIDRNAAAAEETAAAIRAAGGEAAAFVADVSEEAEVEAAVKAVGERYGPVTTLFNHAGTILIKPFLEISLAEWDWLHAVNVRSMFLMTRAVLPQMIANGGGSIVCTSSISAVAATPMEVLYDTTKGAVHMFARAIAVERHDLQFHVTRPPAAAARPWRRSIPAPRHPPAGISRAAAPLSAAPSSPRRAR